MTTAEFLSRLVAILTADLLLSGDNAVVIALVCRDLSPRLRTLGMTLGTVAAVALRVIGALFAATLLALPGLRLLGGALLLWIAFGLVRRTDEDEGTVPASDDLWRAVWLVAVADASMSLDNVVAIAALAQGDRLLMTLGVVISIPLVVVGARVIAALIDRLPLLVWVGAALLGGVAGGVLISDPLLAPHVSPLVERVADAIGAAGVIVAALIYNSWRGRSESLARRSPPGQERTTTTHDGDGMMKIWAKTKKFAAGKFLVVRRDGTIPAWPHFVMGARDPAVPFALRAYAHAADGLGYDPEYGASIRELADDFEAYRAREGNGDADAAPHRKDDAAIIGLMSGIADNALVTLRRERRNALKPEPTQPCAPPPPTRAFDTCNEA